MTNVLLLMHRRATKPSIVPKMQPPRVSPIYLWIAQIFFISFTLDVLIRITHSSRNEILTNNELNNYIVALMQ